MDICDCGVCVFRLCVQAVLCFFFSSPSIVSVPLYSVNAVLSNLMVLLETKVLLQSQGGLDLVPNTLSSSVPPSKRLARKLGQKAAERSRISALLSLPKQRSTDIPWRFLIVTRCRENLSSGENRAASRPQSADIPPPHEPEQTHLGEPTW